MKNGFIEEVGSEESQGKTNQNDNGKKEERWTLDKNKFHISASIGFDEGFYSKDYDDEDFPMRKSGLSTKLLIDYWFNKIFAFGLEIGGLYLFQSKADSGYVFSNERNFFITPNIKIGIPYRSNWGLFLLVGAGPYLVDYERGYINETWLFFNVGLGGRITLQNHYEFGLIIENMLMKASIEDFSANFYLLSISPYVGYVF